MKEITIWLQQKE